MRNIRVALALGAALAFSTALAGGPKSVEVTVQVDGKYSVSAYRLGTAELVGYLGDRKEEAGVEAVVFVGKGATSENEGALAKLAARAGMKSFVKEDGKLRELVVDGGGSAPVTAEKQ